jgi:hypothetical protein
LDGNPLQWRWVNELGVHNAVDARELVDALLTGRMTPHVWVWRTGWTSWIRASQVADLATAIPKGARLPVVAIAIDPSAVEPPPMPRYSYPSSGYIRRMSTPVPAAMHKRPLVRRPVAPTLVESQTEEANISHTLRPPGAVPPPPRTFSGSFNFDVQRALDLANFASDGATPILPSVNSPDLVMRSVLGGDEAVRPDAMLSQPAIDIRQSQQSDLAEMPSAKPLNAPRKGRKLLLIGSFSIVAAVVLIAIVIRNRGASEKAEAAHNAAASGSTSTPPIQPCKLVGSAERLTPSIALNVAPIVANAPDGKWLAVGFADTANSAAGILVNPLTRAVKYAFREAGNRRVASVVPRVQGSELTFAVARDSETFKEARVVVGAPEFSLGQTVEGFARQLGNSNPETIWPTDIDTPCTGPRLVSVPNLGHAVTFRQGGQSGSIQVGWLTPDGHSRVAPGAIKADAKSIGQPNIAVSDSKVVVTFAARNSDAEPWAVHAALVPSEGPSSTAQRLALPAGGPGGDAIAPVAAGLGEGRFILQWSEGATGHRQVRVQTLDAKLQPWGPVVNVSPIDTNAGQGVLWVNGVNAVSLFVVNVGRSAELWAASLQCSE